MSVNELAFCRVRLLDVSIVEFCDLEARRGIRNGSIKNWPSILSCCLGGVRGIGHTVNVVEGSFVAIIWTVTRENSVVRALQWVIDYCSSLKDQQRPIIDCLFVDIHMLQWDTAAMHKLLYMQNARIIEGQVGSTFVP